MTREEKHFRRKDERVQAEIRWQTFKRRLIEEAKEAEICSGYLDRLHATHTPSALIEMYYRGTDFCISNQFPSREILERYMEREANEANIYLRGEHTIVGAKRSIVRGTAHVEATCRGGEIFSAHVTEEGFLRIKALYGSTVFVDVYEGAGLSINFDPTRPPRSIYITKWQGNTRILINGVDEAQTAHFPIVRIKDKDTPYPTAQED